MSYFDNKISVRLHQKVYNDVSNIVKFNRDLYENESHFIRCAVQQLINKHKLGGQK